MRQDNSEIRRQLGMELGNLPYDMSDIVFTITHTPSNQCQSLALNEPNSELYENTVQLKTELMHQQLFRNS